MARILIIGGSLGGLMAANLLLRAGHEVTVLEKAHGALDGRGAGIVTHGALVSGLARCGLAEGIALGITVHKRVTLGGAGAQQHAVLGEMEMTQLFTSWGRLYQLLHGLLPEGVYRQGMTVERFEQDAAGVQVHAVSGAERSVWQADLVIASDGIRSVVRQQMFPQAQPDYAGYVGWRGVCEESLLSQRTLDAVFDTFGFCLPPGEQLIGYPVAGPGQRTGVGERAYNFVWYRPAPQGPALNGLLTDDLGVLHPQGIAPNKVSAANVAVMRAKARRLLARPFAEIIEKTSHPFLQPIYDLSSDALVQGRVALMGDAAFVARPHVGMGVTKAMQDALALTDAITNDGATPQALKAYEKLRLPEGQQVVARGRRLGAYMQASAQHNSDTIARDAHSVMRETAVDLDLVPA
ncbi:MAG: FAD-dependent monooxygenase [Bdellovibrionales bacterium]|nr:FAD-dependent monooxygenase [Ramlibacter sp.]